MVKKRIWLGLLIMMLLFGMTVVGCNHGTNETESGNGTKSGNVGLSGTWGGNVAGTNTILTITSTGWTISPPDYSGTYVMNGIIGTLLDIDNAVVGTGVILDSNTLSITLSTNILFPSGTYTFYRQ